MKHIWSVLCQKSSIDIDTNMMSLFNCLEELNVVIDRTGGAGEHVVIPVELQLVSFFSGENADSDGWLDLRVEIVDPTGRILNAFENRHEVKKGFLRFRNRANIQGLPVTTQGRYIFRLLRKADESRNFEVISELPLDVKLSYRIMDGVKFAKK